MAQTVLQSLRYEGDPVKGSRFIVDVAPVSDETDAKALVAAAASEFADASHHCSAWRLVSPMIERASDDGEPGGSAGRPILAQIAGRDLVDVAVVVTRYFGGTKLGVGGLVRAYGGAAGEALGLARCTPWVAFTEVVFEHDYSLTDAVDRAVTLVEGTTLKRTFAAAVHQHVRLPRHELTRFSEALADVTAGDVTITEIT